MLDKKAKQRIIEKFKVHEKDTGSSEVQIAILTYEIRELAKHLKAHRKDHSSRRGLLRKVGERRRLLTYLKKENLVSWESLIKALKIKTPQILKRTTMPAATDIDEVLAEDISPDAIIKE